MFRTVTLALACFGVAILAMDDLANHLQIKMLVLQNETYRLELETLNENTENEIAFYVMSEEELQEQNRLLTKTIDIADLKQTKIKEVKDIIRSTIYTLPNTEDYRAARRLNVNEVTKIAKYIVEYSDQYDVPLNLAVALIKQESAFNVKAVSRVGAQGLTQLMPATAEMVRRQLGKTKYNPWSSQDNVQFGIFYFSTLLDMYKDNPLQYKLAVNAYNAGPGNVFKVLRKETIEHETYIFRYASEFREQGL